MRSENFIPDKNNFQVDPLDSDNSSIHGDGDYINGGLGEAFLSTDENINENDSDETGSNDSELSEYNLDSDGDEDLSSDGSDLSDVRKQSDDDQPGTSRLSDNKSKKGDVVDDDDDDDEDDSDCDSMSSEEATATMQDIFGTKPNREACRNHPPNFKTDSPTLDLCFHPESDLLAAASIDGDCVVYRYNLEKVEEVTRFTHHKKSCRQICFNADGSLLYTISKDKSLAVVDTQNSAVKIHLKDAHESPLYSFCEIDNNICATGDDDGMVKLWDLRKPDPLFDFKCGEQTITSLVSCEAKKYLSATVSDGSLTGFNLRKRRMEAQSEMFDSEFTSQSLVRSDTRLVVGSGSGIMYIFNWGDFGYNVDALSGHPDLIQCQAAITDKMIITGCEDGNIRAVQLYNHKFLGIIGQHKDFGVENLAVSCDGYLLASCSMDEEIQFWNIEYLYGKLSTNRKRTKSKSAVSVNLSSSKKRNPREFFRDIPAKMEPEDEGGPVPSTSYDSD